MHRGRGRYANRTALFGRGLVRTPTGKVAVIVAFAVGVLCVGGCGETTNRATTNEAAKSHSQGTTITGQQMPATGHSPTQRQASSASAQSKETTGTGTGHARSRRRTHLVLPPAGSHVATGISAAEREELPVTDIALSSQGISRSPGSSNAILERRYTCEGGNISPPLQWRNIPAGARELVLFVLGTQPVSGKLAFSWAVAGLDPRSSGIEVGHLPKGAVVGRNTSGGQKYSVCPSHKPESYLFVVYALDKALSPKAGFDPLALRAQAIHSSRHVGILVGRDV